MNFRRLLFFVLIAAVIAALAYGGAMYFTDRQGPQLALEPSSGAVNLTRELNVTVRDLSGIRTLQVVAVQNGKSATLVSQSPEDKPESLELAFNLADAGLKEGSFEITVTAIDTAIYNFGKGNAASSSFSLALDTKPPSIAVQSGAHNLNQGGSGLVAYTVSEDAVKTGVTVGERFFPGYRQDTGTTLAFFAFPYDVNLEDFEPVIMAVDEAGNEAKAGFRHHANARKFKSDIINIPPSFLQSKMPQFRDRFPDAKDDLALFLVVNNELRKQNRAYHLELASKTSPAPLWSGTFIRLPNSARMASFGDHRTYYFDGEEIDQQTHLGIDLASVEAADVPAANAGVAIYAGEFGIYGQTVVVDHGLGLMSLYGHLRQINVAEGETVTKGQILGKTGTTGLAGGDHLHLGMYVSGVPVNPIEWWDQHWIDVNVMDRIGM